MTALLVMIMDAFTRFVLFEIPGYAWIGAALGLVKGNAK